MSRKKWTLDKIRDFVRNEGYVLLTTEEIKNCNDKIQVMCPSGHKYLVRATNFIHKSNRCPQCQRYSSYTNKEAKELIESKGYIWLDTEFKGVAEKVKVMCKKGHIRDVVFDSIRVGYFCKVCSDEEKASKKRHSYDYIKRCFESRGYTLVSKEYQNNNKILETRCPRGHKHMTSFSNFRDGKRCKKCHYIDNPVYHKLTKEKVEANLSKEDYLLLSKTINSSYERLIIRCPKGHHFTMSWNSFQNGSRCPICNESKGERRITNFLECKNITYEKQYRIGGCQSKRILPFDFYLPEYKLLIEYDGKQHYEIVKFYGGLDGFISRRIKDEIKNWFCETNNIPLLRIPYWEFDNIEKILTKELKLK